MTDRLDDLLFSIGEEQNDRVDFDQMYADLLKKQKEEEKKRSIRRSRFVRYGAMAACAVVLTVATAVAMPEEVIWFGVLHLLGCAALLTCLLHPALEKLPPLAGVTGSAVLFALLPLLL